MTTDTEQAGEFYKKILPLETGPMPAPTAYTIFSVGDNQVAGKMNISDMEPEGAGLAPNRSIYFGTTDAEG